MAKSPQSSRSVDFPTVEETVGKYLYHLRENLESNGSAPIPPRMANDSFNLVYQYIACGSSEGDTKERIIVLIKDSLSDYLPTISSYIDQFEGKQKLEIFSQKWTRFQSLQVGYKAAFAAVDYSNVGSISNTPVCQIIRKEFYDRVFLPLIVDLKNLFLEYCESERLGLVSDPIILRSVCQLLAEMETVQENTFRDQIFNPLLLDLRELYSQKREELLALSFSDYVDKAHQYVTTENEILRRFIRLYINHLKEVAPPPPKTQGSDYADTSNTALHAHGHAQYEDTLAKALYEELIVHAREVLFDQHAANVNSLMIDKSIVVKKVYELFKETDRVMGNSEQLSFLSNIYASFIEGCYREVLVDDLTIDLVSTLLDIVEDTKFILSSLFMNDAIFQRVFNATHKGLCRQLPSLPIVLANFLHKQMSVGFNRLTDVEVSTILEKSLDCFVFCVDKLSFEHHYKSQLAERLLNGSSKLDYEKDMINLFKTELGVQVYSLFMQMISDILISSSKLRNFDAASSTPLPISFIPTVITAGRWPYSFFTGEVKLPPPMEQAQNSFIQYYNSIFQSRKIAFQPSLGTVEIEFKPSAQRTSYILSVPTPMGLVLMCFNRKKALKYQDIKAMTNLPDEDLRMVIPPLIGNSVLLKHKTAQLDLKNPHFAPDFLLAMNIKFSNQRLRISIARFRPFETQNKARVDNDLLSNRNMEMDAVIVRLMKTNRTF
ncbi:hypothetical protein GEMRC1_006364 [Eukaryota sp. GEM-RC1]